MPQHSYKSEETWDFEVRRGSEKDITSSATLTNDGVLLIPVKNGFSYIFELILIYSEPAASGTPDIKHAFAISGGASISNGIRQHFGQDAALAAATAVVADMTTAIVNGALGSKRMARVDGQFEIGTADGVLDLQWAQNTSSGNATRVYAGSLLRWKVMD